MCDLVRFFRLLCFLCIVPLAAACSEQVAWQEEIRLNTGETLLIRRTLTFERGGSPGNPLRSTWRSQPGGTLEFDWRGQHYVFTGHNGPLLVAISPSGRPVVVANAEDGRWDARHGYGCTTPHYVEFIPDKSGAVWTWLPTIEPWLYRLPANLLLEVPRPGASTRRYTAADIHAINDSLNMEDQGRFVDPSFVADHCKRKG